MRVLRRGRPGRDPPSQALPGACFSTCCHRAYAVGAKPIGAPGWPLLARSTASMERKRMALMDRHATSLLMADLETVWTFDKVEIGDGV